MPDLFCQFCLKPLATNCFCQEWHEAQTPYKPVEELAPTGAESRLRAWVRDFGHTSQRPFVKDLEAVLDQLADFRTRTLTPPAASSPP